MSVQEQILQLFLGQIPEAIYFSIFMIISKQLKTKRMIYIILMILEYVILKQFIHYNIWFQFLYTFMSFMILKILYKERAQVTDIFTFSIASIILIITSAIPYIIIWKTVNNYILYVIINRIIIFSLLYIFRHKIPKIQNLYRKLWNRNDKVKKKIKTTTFRALNIVIFNCMFYIINLGMIFMLIQK